MQAMNLQFVSKRSYSLQNATRTDFAALKYFRGESLFFGDDQVQSARFAELRSHFFTLKPQKKGAKPIKVWPQGVTVFP